MVWDFRSLCDKTNYAIIQYAINQICLYTGKDNIKISEDSPLGKFATKASPHGRLPHIGYPCFAGL